MEDDDVAQYRLFAANYNQNVRWVYKDLRSWLAERGVDLILAQCESEDEVIRIAQGADIYLAYQFEVTRQVIAALPKLKLLMSSGSGFDHIDVPAATEHRVVVTCGRTYNIEDVAEHAVTLIMACSRKLRFLEQAVRRGQWQTGAIAQPRYRLVGQTVGLIGFGLIARAVAWRARGLGCQVVVYDPYVSPAEIKQQGVEPVDLPELLARADFVSLHLRLNDETRHLLSEDQFKAMKATAYVVNTSRGGVIDEAALHHALKNNWIAGAGLDVLEQEPPDLNNPLLDMENVMVTGHAAGTSIEGVQAWQDEWRQIIEDFIAGYWPINVVNPTVQPKVSLRKRSGG